MQATSRFSLEEIVNTQILQEIQDKFAESTGIAAVIVDAKGNPVTRPSNFTQFCSYVRTYDLGRERCMACDDRAGRAAAAKHRPIVYLCHNGLTDMAAPIIVQGEYIGAFLAGQAVPTYQNSDPKQEMIRRVSESSLGIDTDVLAELFDKIDFVPENRLKAAVDLIYIMSNYIVEIGVANIMQKQLMSELKAKADLENILRATELRALQSQVNPHFLFNTLNTIARLALLEGATKTQEVVYALADLLRNNLRDIDVLRTMEQEVRSIKDYLMIQEVRFGDRIRTCIDVNEDILDARIPALTLQPIIENAIIHGLEGKADGGEVHVMGRQEGDDVILTVRDTGVGIPEDKVRTLLHQEKRATTQGQTTGLGVTHVHKRIQHYFGVGYGVHVASTPGEGTVVDIRIPFSRS